MFVITSYLIDAVAADYILTPLTALSSGGETVYFPFQPVWKIAKKSFKHRVYVKYAITRLNIMRADFVRNG